MEKIIYIYTLKDPRDYQVKYIGKTIDVNRRLKEHTKPYNLKTNSLKNNWLKHIIGLGHYPIMEILEECNKLNWEEKERYWINYYRELGFDLKNMTNGGEGTDGAVMSDDFKLNLSKKRKGKNNPYYGKKHSEEILEKIALASKDRNNPRAIFINVIDRNGKVIFNGIRKEVFRWCNNNGICSESNMKNHLYSGEEFNPKYVMTAYPNCKDYVGIKFVYA
jgi:group I intron endonuclease